MDVSRKTWRLTRRCRPSGRGCSAAASVLRARQPAHRRFHAQRTLRAYQWPRATHESQPGLATASLAEVLNVSEEVKDALATNKPVVALESTIYTHGALGMDLRLESIVRENGAVPAVVGVLAGRPTVGLTPAEIQRMIHEGAKKVSRRDLAYLVGTGMTGRGGHGGTTISGTMILARFAGIRVFGTGGLGGVHRGWQQHMDISADLTELGRTRVAVISSGCKGFLDIPATLEYLETQGVHISTFADGRSGDVKFPAFWARESGVKSPAVVRDEREAASIILAQERLGIETGLLFANPIPEKYAIPARDMDAVIETAVREAAEQGFSGNENTPFILRRIRELTAGASVPANVALVQANVARAARVAAELCALMPEAAKSAATFSFPPSRAAVDTLDSETAATVVKTTSNADILVAGSVALDLSCDFACEGKKVVSPQMHTSNPACISHSIGGVGHNVALAAHRISPSQTVKLCSMIGDDAAILAT